MMDKKVKPTKFTGLDYTDKDLTMFTITSLVLINEDDMVHMVLNLKRKVAMELLTTYLPTILLLLGLFDISISDINCRYIDTFEKY